MLSTIADVLARPDVRAGAPVVRAGRDALHTEVRWVHVSEVADPAGTLPDGVLVLSAGIPAADPTTDPVRYVEALRRAGAVGLLVEIGQHVTALPGPLVQAARTAGFPLVELRRTVRFAEIVAGVLEQVLAVRDDRAPFAAHAGSVFRTLTLHRVPPARIVVEAARLLGLPVVCEDLAHRVLLASGDPDLRDWRGRSRLAGPAGPEGWLVAPVGRPEAVWGRLAVPARPAAEQVGRVAVVVENAADALALLDPDPVALLHTAHDELVTELAGATPVDVDRLAVEARARGIVTTGEFDVALLTGPDPATLRARAVDAARSGVVAILGAEVVVIAPTGDLEGRLPPGAAVAGPGGFGRLPELLRAAARAGAAHRGAGPGPHHHDGIGVHDLVHRLRDDPRLLAFVERTLGPVLALAPDEREHALDGLRALAGAGGVVADVARRIGTGRPAAYARIRRLSALLGADLTDPEVRTAVHVALVAVR